MTVKLFACSLAAFASILTSCSEDIFSAMGDGDAVELKDVRTTLDGSATSRAAALAEYAGRDSIVANDMLVFTNIQRTSNPIANFTYIKGTGEGKYTDGIKYKCNSELTWKRDGNEPERIYWSDAASAHTFVGYACPQGDNTAAGFDWNDRVVGEGSESTTTWYFGSLGNPTADDAIDYTNDTPTTEPTTEAEEQAAYTTGNAKIKGDDILLAYNIAQVADLGGQVATIHLHHGLCEVRVIVNISGFAASAESDDSKSRVTGLTLKDMLTMYKWTQTGYTTTALNAEDQKYLNSIWSSETTIPQWDQKKNINAWTRHPEGNGTGTGRTFTYYALAVPETGKSQSISFKVKYPDPLHPSVMTEKEYHANLSNVDYRAGYCTTIHISLNHQNDEMTVGAEYDSWDFIETPDETQLKKNETMLTADMLKRENFNTSTQKDAGNYVANVDDATWLYIDTKDNNKLKDIYGNEGTPSKPFTISTAPQLVAFAYEVREGRNFAHQYVKLDADITMQEDLKLPTYTTGTDEEKVENLDYSKMVEWIGIGADNDTPNADNTYAKSFEGIFNGNGRNIIYLYGKPLFNTIGYNAVVNKLNISNIVKVNGTGAIANKNDGLICGCNVNGDVEQAKPTDTSKSYCGSLVGTNNSFIIGCTHVGNVSGYGTIAGLVGYNRGTLIACYHAGSEVNLGSVNKFENVYAGVGGYYVDASDHSKDSQAFSCYFNKDLNKHDYADLIAGKMAYPRTTGQMQSKSFIDATEDLIHETGAEGNDNFFKRHVSLNKAMEVFCQWLNSLPAEQSYTTNCRTFSAYEIEFLKAHYNSSHRFQYTPGAYPKVQ